MRVEVLQCNTRGASYLPSASAVMQALILGSYSGHGAKTAPGDGSGSLRKTWM